MSNKELTVKDLIELLKQYPADAPVYIKEKTIESWDGAVLKSWQWIQMKESNLFTAKIGGGVYVGQK